MKFKSPKSLKNRIYKSDWHSTRPMGIISPSDAYFVQLSNQILSIIDNLTTNEIFEEAIKRKIAISIAAYFEDVISEFGLWRAFLALHHDMFGKFLPFYDIHEDDYFEDEINRFDILFLIWCFLQREDIENEIQRFLNPENPLLTNISDQIFDLLESEYETAPANESVYKYIHVIDHTKEFISARELIAWLHYDCYLALSYPRQNMLKQSDIFNDKKADKFYKENEDVLRYSIEKSLIFSSKCSPLAIYAKDWMAQIFAGTPKEKIIKSIIYKQIDNYHILDFDNETFTIINAEKEKYIVSLDSVNNPPSMKVENFIMCAIVYFKGLWHVNGFASFGRDKRELERKEDKSEIREDIQRTYEFILKKSNKPIQYFKNADDLSSFLLKLFPNTDKNKILPKNYSKYTDFVTFVDPEIGLTFYPEIAVFIKDKNNPYYNIQDVEDQGLAMLTGYFEIPMQFMNFLIKNNLLSDISINSLLGKEYGNKQIQENIEFVVRFFQPELYK